MIQYFGQRWDAPLLDGAQQVATPVGSRCLWCHEAVEEGDSGLMQLYVDNTRGRLVPYHVECHLRAVLGSFEHLRAKGQCPDHPDPDPALSLRDEARAVLAYLNEERSRAGIPPLHQVTA